MRKTQLKYPEFLKCCNHTDDMFWKFIFEDLAYGNTPYNVYIYKGNLCCNIKGREFVYRIDFSNSQSLFETVYNLFTTKLNIISQSEKENTYKNFVNEKDDSKIEWKDIKKKNLKDILLQRYVIDMKNVYSLTIEQAKRLLKEDKNVTETCFECGFESLSYFNRIFKKVVGQNPIQFKKI